MPNPKISIITVTKNRTTSLIKKAGISLRTQDNHDFEWIVISDGYELETENAILQFSKNVPWRVSHHTVESQDSAKNFGLCVGRNLGIELAMNPYITYLDDDNSFKPNFVRSTLEFITSHPQAKYLIPQAQRTRGYWNRDRFIATNNFISPRSNTSLNELLTHKQLFDSNGFVHQKANCPNWQSQFRIYCDYEYLLQCIQAWGTESFALNYQILVDYIQSDRGIIGSSSYQSWAAELDLLLTHSDRYSALKNSQIQSTLHDLKEKYLHKSNNTPTAFNKKKTHNDHRF